jgi:hypothetical protein
VFLFGSPRHDIGNLEVEIVSLISHGGLVWELVE